MPLHTEAPRVSGVLDGLDHPIRGPRHRLELPADGVDRLVMPRADLDAGGPTIFANRLSFERASWRDCSLGAAVWDVIAKASGTWACRVPPQTTLSTCMPRQMQSIGSDGRASAARVSANSNSSRSSQTE
jgi:hypothetical protein